MTNPTQHTYDALNVAYDFFNERLFGGGLPRCLITMQRRNRTRGYFAGKRFGTRDEAQVTDEIALNPQHFRERTTEQILSTLVHEMCHLQQHHFGKSSRSGYHNKEWGRMMLAVGLVPSDTGKPGGRQVGQSVTHYIAEDGPFALACADLLRQGFDLLYVDLRNGDKDRGKAASKTKYTCPACDLNAWGKPDIHLICGGCGERLRAESAEQTAIVTSIDVRKAA